MWTLNLTTILGLVEGRKDIVRQRRRDVTIEQKWGDTVRDVGRSQHPEA